MIKLKKENNIIYLQIFNIKITFTLSLGKFIYKSLRPIIYILDYIVPKNKNKIIFNSFPDYGDNARAYYLFLKNNSNYKLIWLVDNLNKDLDIEYSYKFNSIIGLYHFITSKYIVTTHNTSFSSLISNDRHVILNLWHGMPIKTIGFNEPNLDKELLKCYKNYGKYAHFFVSSDIFKQLMLSTFEGKYFNSHITGQPRTDLIWDKSNSKKIEELFHFSKYKKVIFYMPTYKENVVVRNSQVDTEYKNIFYMNDYNESEFIKYLEENDILFIMKPHPFDEPFYEKHMDTIPRSENFKFVKNEFFLNNEINHYEIFKYIDLMISDFSSVVIDYMILNKPVIFLNNLTNEYSSNRGMILSDNFNILMPGIKVDNFKSLKLEIEENLKNDKYKELRNRNLPLLHKHCDNKACERVFKIMRGL